MTAGRRVLMKAMLDLTCEGGYESATIDRLAARSGASKGEFEAIFASREDCAMAVLDEIAASALNAAREAFESTPTWPDSLRASAYGLVRWISENPKETRFGMVEMLWAGEMTRARRDAFFQAFIDMIDAGRMVAKAPEMVPARAAEGVVGAITEMLAKHLQKRGGVTDPYAFIPQLMYLAVLPYQGEEAARRELTMPPPRQGTTDR